jgi:hypothetical protein
MPINKDGFNNFALELRMLEENQATPEAELINASFRQLQGILSTGEIKFDPVNFENIEQFGQRELVKQLSDTRAIYKRPEKRWVGGGWDVFEAKYWRLEVIDADDVSETTEPEYSITIMPRQHESPGVFEEGIMPNMHVVDVIFDGHVYPLGGRLHPGVYSEPRVQEYLDNMIDILQS